MQIRTIHLPLYLLLFLNLATSTNLFSQKHFLLENFNAFRDKDKIILQWTLGKGNTCHGIGVLRSNSNSNFTLIGEISGVCGSSDTETRYTFIDDNPIPNSTNHYILELGFAGRTEPSLPVFYAQYDHQGLTIIPHPITQFSTIYFYNPSGETRYISIYDQLGRSIFQTITNTNSAQIELSDGGQHDTLIKYYLLTIANEQGIVLHSTPIIIAQ